ncbi:MAG TPA: sodium ABC transporter ATP-binding protein [Gemmatimonadetes bacterium]|nr:sodium ABC transporter ATP-binding protein [Gemmatimonadota bacterium]HAT37995.1 sodium ABC transporter ATP-binding protein [Gemmatimonadota bacterium]HBV07039.1 sodium ABC transporter ATP-binding protein [Gemmatimonadota bacterium]
MIGVSSGRLVLEAKGLHRNYGSIVAVGALDLSMSEGEFLTIVGPNGAGKSTLLSILSGAMRPTTGSVRVCGEELDFARYEWRHRIGMLSHQGFLYDRMTVEENLSFYGKLFGISDLEDRIASRLRRVGLSERARSEVRKLSHGMRQRASLARALLHDPDVVLLDEPYSGLDPAAAVVLRDVLEELKDGRRTVVMVTHNLREGLEMATRIAIQVGGRFEWEGSLKGALWKDFESHYHSVVEGRV